jgi:hypothetical protein
MVPERAPKHIEQADDFLELTSTKSFGTSTSGLFGGTAKSMHLAICGNLYGVTNVSQFKTSQRDSLGVKRRCWLL